LIGGGKKFDLYLTHFAFCFLMVFDKNIKTEIAKIQEALGTRLRFSILILS